MQTQILWSIRSLSPMLLSPMLVLALAALPTYASNHNSDKTILIVTDYWSPFGPPESSSGTGVSGLDRDDDDKLVYYLGAGDPAFVGGANEGKVNFGNGVSGATNETLLVDSLGYNVDTRGMGGTMQQNSFFWLGFDDATLDAKDAVDNADLIIMPLNRSGNYRDDRYRDVSVAGGGDGTLDSLGLSVQQSWNGIETPLLSFNSAVASGAGTAAGANISFRFGWTEFHADNKSETATRMQIQPDQLSNPFFTGLTTTADPDVTGGVEVEIYDWTYDPALGYVDGLAPLPVDLSGNVDLNGFSRGPSITRRDDTDPLIGEENFGVVPGGKIVSGLGGTNANGGGANIIDIPKDTDFNVPDEFGVATNIPGDDLNKIPFGVAGARRVLLPTWGYSLPVLGAGAGHQWGEFQTADYFKLTENVIAEMLENPDGAVMLDGDFDTDGDVDGADFLKWQRDLGDATNLALWEGNFGATAAASASASAVPEPSSFLLAVVLALALTGGKRRCQR